MAIISFPSPTQPKGSIDGAVYYKNGGQLALRSRARPITVKSEPHRQIMSIIGDLSMRWEQVLSPSDRIAWGNYAYNSPLTDAYGMPFYIRGYAHYMRSNRPRLAANVPAVIGAPLTPGFPDFLLPVSLFNRDTNQLDLFFDTTDPWTQDSGALMLVSVSRPRPPVPLRPPETYSLIGTATASPGFDPYGPPFDLPFQIPANDCAIFVRFAVTRSDGRYTSSEAS